MRLVARAGLLGLALLLATTPSVWANCYPIASLPGATFAGLSGGRLVPVALPAAGQVRLSFLGHSSFLIESAGGVTAVTDYNGVIQPPAIPDVITMNNAHSTHYTEFFDPKIKHVLRGWDPEGGVALHAVTLEDLHVRNIPTNVRDFGGARMNGNSIFVFEVADLCIAHLGHLHHLLTDVHLGELGQIDVLLVPVDGSYTMAQELMREVIAQIAPSVIIPMHYFGTYTLGRFLKLMDGPYRVAFGDTPEITLSRATLPYKQVLVLPGG